MFSCKLNSKYKKALNWVPAKKKVLQTNFDEDDYDDNNEDHIWVDHNNLDCCGISEITIGDVVSRDTPKNRKSLAQNIREINIGDKRTFIIGLPLSKVGGGSSDYNFKNYRVIRKILLDFGMKQITPRTYVNKNSNNRLSVLVGQLP